jgi:LemA protein
VATVRAAAASEERILTNVTQARANATRITLTPEQLSDPAAMSRYQDAQNRLSAAILPLRQLQEAYPELQSQRNFGTLMSQLEGTENRIAIAIRDYNEAVRAFNTEIRTFPSVIGARVIHGAQPMVPFQATTPNADQAPTVDFGNGG